SFDFLSKPFTTRVAVHALQIGIFTGAISELDTIVAGEIRAGFCRGNDIVNGNRILAVWEMHLLDLAPQLFKCSNGTVDIVLNVWIQTRTKPFSRHSDTKPVNIPIQLTHVVVDGVPGAGRVVGIVTGDHLE